MDKIIGDSVKLVRLLKNYQEWVNNVKYIYLEGSIWFCNDSMAFQLEKLGLVKILEDNVAKKQIVYWEVES